MNWFVGQYDSDISYSYDPERLIALVPVIARAFRDEVGLNVYAVVAQGANEYEDTALLHHSKSGNHISLNSVGLPFAQLLAIDQAARTSIHENRHQPTELYLDAHFFRSLRFRYGFGRDAVPSARYSTPLTQTPGEYFCIDCQTILENVDLARSGSHGGLNAV